MGRVLSDERLQQLAERLTTVPGIVGVALGGSRARGDQHPDSDVDLGLYYRPPLDVAGLRTLARAVATGRPGDPPVAEVTEPGGWGPWVDGGGWLQVDDTPVDWIFRDVDRVARSVEQSVRGEVDLHFQVGHPFGFPDSAYAGELALGVLLADPSGELSRLRERLVPYPDALRQEAVDRLGEADFLLGAVAKSAKRGDATYVAGILFRVVILCASAVHARAGRWVVNEKGLVDAAGRLPGAPPDFTARAHGILADLGSTPDSLLGAVETARELVAAVRG